MYGCAWKTQRYGLLLQVIILSIIFNFKYLFYIEDFDQILYFSCRYYSVEKVAPVLTIFIGGNHEASNYLQELAYGGWVAPNIYYLGYASVVTVAGLRIAGLSGIFKSHDLMRGHHEYPPYNNSTMRSAYHIRNLEVFRLKQVLFLFFWTDAKYIVFQYYKINYNSYIQYNFTFTFNILKM